MSRLPLLVALLAAAPVLAQSERVTIKLVPAADQTLRFHHTQDMDMTTEAGELPGGRPMPPMALKMHTVIDATSTIGPTDNQGHYTSRMTIDHLALESTMNGKPMPVPIPAADAMEKQVITFTYDDQGTVVDVAVDGAPKAGVGDAIKQLMTRAFATLAPMTLSVGESTTVPMALSLPIPGAPVAAAGGFGISGETRYTLTSVTFDGADRIAHLTLRVSSNVSPGSTPSAGSMAMNIATTGEGKMDVNVDRGIVLHSEQRSTIDSTVQAPAAAAEAPRMRMHGTFSSVSDLVK